MSGRLHITYDDGHHHPKVEIAGEFTGWQPVPLGLDKETTYAAIFDGAEPNERYQYKFIVNDQWTLLPTYPTTTDASGFVNHYVVATAPPSHGASSNSKTSASDYSGPIEEPYEVIGGQLDQTRDESKVLDQVKTPTVQQQSSTLNRSTYPGTDFSSPAALNDPYSGEPSYTEDSFLKDSYLNKSTLEDSLSKDAYLKDSSLKDSLSKDSYLKDSYPKESTWTENYGSKDYLDSNQNQPVSQGFQGTPVVGETYPESYGLQSSHTTNLEKAQPEQFTGGIQHPFTATSQENSLPNAQNHSQYAGYQQHSLRSAFGDTSADGAALSGNPLSGTTPSFGGTDLGEYGSSLPGTVDPRQLRTGSQQLSDPYAQTSHQQSAREPYELVGSELEKSTEVVSGLDELPQQTQHKPAPEHTSAPYELTSSDLSKPAEKVDGLDNVNSPHGQHYQNQHASRDTDAAKDSGYGMPGSLPYETGLVDQTPYSTGYADTSSSARFGQDDSYDTQNFESAGEELDEPDFLAAALAGVSLNNTDRHDTSGKSFPTSTSDRTLKQALEGSESVDVTKSEAYYALDRLAGSDPVIAKNETVIIDPGVPSVGDSSDYVDFDDLQDKEYLKSTSQEQPKLQSPYGSLYGQSKKPHVPIDVNTGFPMDEPPSPASQSSRQRSLKYRTGSQFRNENRRPLSHAGVPVPASSFNAELPSSENRNAAVIAAASRASAFAKQDVAAISDPSQYHTQQTETLSRSPSDAHPRTRPQSMGGFGKSKRLSEQRSRSSFSRDRPSSQLSRSDTKKEGRVRRFFRKIGGGQ